MDNRNPGQLHVDAHFTPDTNKHTLHDGDAKRSIGNDIANDNTETWEADTKVFQNEQKILSDNVLDADSGIDVNGDCPKPSEADSKRLGEDEVMDDAGEGNQSGVRLSAVSECAPAIMSRRSTRNRKVPINYEDEYVIPAAKEPVRATAASSRPKRKAPTAAQKTVTSKEDLDLVTETICAPMVSDELRSYRGWVELESEPSFFQAMLQEVGAPDLKITELFSTDEASIGALSKPIHGLIFLFPYENVGEQNAEERHDCPDDLWFANQTTANGCATVALMNITMNIPDPSYGPELRRFKQDTAPLSSVDRGRALDTNDFIRCIHNSVARRTQLLNEDLAWKNKVDEEVKEQQRRGRAIKASRGRGKAKRRSNTNSKKITSTGRKKDWANMPNHYIAYVPHDGKVWEFDGLEDKPLCLGHHLGDRDDWVMTAIETIQLRMAAGAFSDTFNLLALCATPLQSLEDRLIQNLAAAQKLEQEYRPQDEAVTGNVSWPHPPISTLFPPEKLESLNHLTWEMAANIGPTEAFLEKISQPNFDREKAALLMAELLVEQSDLETELASEINSHQRARLEYESRQRDFTPFIHQFLLALAETGKFEETVAQFVER
jgi:ubiquitin carboxyl-terminal hydrolase L5